MGKKKNPPAIDAVSLSDKIERTFKKFGDNISIFHWTCQAECVRFRVKLKGGTRKTDVDTHASDVQSRLGLPFFQVITENLNTYIVVSDHQIEYPRLLEVLDSSTCEKMLLGLKLPYLVGHDIMGCPTAVDLAAFPHLLLGGSTCSGKSVGAQALITCNVYIHRPSRVNFILIDVGAGDLMAFDGIPHLSCPVVRDVDAAYHTLGALKSEMERRISLEHTNIAEYKRLPRLVLVIDEFPALFTELSSKDMSQSMATTISSLLQRGRHAKIHVVLAAQNPTFRNMKVDLANITARIAFRCAKKNFSETILGEGGAENLSGKGSLFLKSPQADGLKWIQGIYIKPKDIQEVVQRLRSPMYMYDHGRKFNLTIPTRLPTEPGHDLHSCLHPVAITAGPSSQDKLLASVMFWTFGQDYISTNRVMIEHHLGWNKATNLVKRLEELGGVDKLDSKKSRCVLPKSIDNLSDELLEFMALCDYPRDSIAYVFHERAGVGDMDKTGVISSDSMG